ncbi:VIP peptides-like [Notamacropus eugenii]|uniref:VIP peptides-like n=1 Tax=Notamacropus eugenii TaxID=9315 RepID=UPI003B67F60D
MESRGNCQLLLSLTLLSAFCSQTLALHSEIYSAMRNRRQDPSFDLSQYLGGEAADEFIEAITGIVCDYCKKNHAPERRHIDGVFTDSYKKHQLKKAVREYLRKVLGPRPKEKEKDSK